MLQCGKQVTGQALKPTFKRFEFRFSEHACRLKLRKEAMKSRHLNLEDLGSNCRRCAKLWSGAFGEQTKSCSCGLVID
jgi:hypothetical protein